MDLEDVGRRKRGEVIKKVCSAVARGWWAGGGKQTRLGKQHKNLNLNHPGPPQYFDSGKPHSA